MGADVFGRYSHHFNEYFFYRIWMKSPKILKKWWRFSQFQVWRRLYKQLFQEGFLSFLTNKLLQSLVNSSFSIHGIAGIQIEIIETLFYHKKLNEWQNLYATQTKTCQNGATTFDPATCDPVDTLSSHYWIRTYDPVDAWSIRKLVIWSRVTFKNFSLAIDPAKHMIHKRIWPFDPG